MRLRRRSTGALRLGLWNGDAEQLTHPGEVDGAVAVSQEPVMADAMQAFGQHMHEEASDELRRGQRHGGVSARTFDAVFDLEGDAIGIGTDQPAVGDGDTVGIAGKIGQHRLGPGERRLSILPIIMGPGSRFVIPTIRCTGKKEWSCGWRMQRANAIFA
jgi:hypothetical protein